MKRQFIIGILSNILIAISSLLFIRFYVTNFGKDNYAIIAIIMAIISAIMNLDGFKKPLVHEIQLAGTDKDKLYNSISLAITFSVALGIFAIVLFYLIIFFNIKSGPASLNNGYILLGGSIFILCYFYRIPFNAYLIYSQRPHLNEINKLIVYLVMFSGFTVLTLTYGVSPIVYTSLILSGVSGILFIFIIVDLPFMPNLNFRRAFKKYAKIFSYGLIFNVSIFLFLTIDKAFLSIFSEADKSDYLIPYDLVLKFSIIHGIVGTVLLGNIVSSFSNSKYIQSIEKKYIYHSLLYIGFIVIISVNLFLYGSNFFFFWLGNDVTNKMLTIYFLLIIAFFMNSFGWLGYNLLLVDGKISLIAKIYSLMPLILIIGCTLFNNILGIYGLVFSVILGRSVDIILFVFSLSNRFHLLKSCLQKCYALSFPFIVALILSFSGKYIFTKFFEDNLMILIFGVILFSISMIPLTLKYRSIEN